MVIGVANRVSAPIVVGAFGDTSVLVIFSQVSYMCRRDNVQTSALTYSSVLLS